MILPFPYKPVDWLSIWHKTKTMTLLTADGDPITITIDSITALEADDLDALDAMHVKVADGEFFISFGDPSEVLHNQLVFQIDGRDPKEGRWHIPQWYIDRCRESTEEK